jgi:hypothetical protein
MEARRKLEVVLEV